MIAIKKFAMTLVAMFGLAVAGSGIAIAAPSNVATMAATATISQYGDDTGVDCTRNPDHPECPQDAPPPQ